MPINVPQTIWQLRPYENISRIREVLGHLINAKIFLKAPSEKAQTTVSVNRYTFPKIDVLQTAILSLLQETTSGRHFWYTPGTAYLCYSPAVSPNFYTQFPLRVWAFQYTCRPIIANLLYPTSDNYKTLTYSKAKSYRMLNKTGRQVRRRMNCKSARFQPFKFQPYTVLLTTLVRCRWYSRSHP